MNVYYYMEFLNIITNVVIAVNFYSNILQYKYNRFLSNVVLFVGLVLHSLCNFKMIDILNLTFFQSNIYKFVSVIVFYVIFLNFLCVNKLKEVVLTQMYCFLMGYTTEILATIFITKSNLVYLTIFIEDSFRMMLSIMGNSLACVVSMFYLLIFFKKKYNIKDNYMFLVLVLPAVQFFVLDKYIVFLQRNITTEFFIIGTIFFVMQIFINIIILNLVMKSILSHDLEQKVYLANLENERNKYIRDLYKNQKLYFNQLIINLKFPLNNILNTGYCVQKNKFKNRDIFNTGLENIIEEAKNLNNRIVDLLDKQKNIF